jgi:hypothetical protein
MSPRLTALIAAAAVTVVAVAGSVGTAPAGTAPGVTAEQIAAGLVANDAALRAAIDAWRADEDPPSAEPPAEVMGGSKYLQETIRTLVRRRSFARNVRDRLPARLEGQVRSLIVAQRDLVRLSNGWPPHEVETGKPEPLANLSGY